MTPKAIITLVIGILALVVTAWKGPTVWGAISTGVSAIALFVGTLSVVPKSAQEYAQDVEDALTQSIGTKSPEATAQLLSSIPAPSRARFARRLAK